MVKNMLRAAVVVMLLTTMALPAVQDSSRAAKGGPVPWCLPDGSCPNGNLNGL